MDRPEGGVAKGSDFQRKFKGKRGAGSGCIEVNSLLKGGDYRHILNLGIAKIDSRTQIF